MAQSTQVAATSSYVWKVTGRYQVANLARLITDTPAGYDLVMNLRRYPGPWADMWVYAVTTAGIDLLATRAEVLRGQEQDETQMYDAVQALAAGGHRVLRRLPREPLIRGVRGWDGRPYDDPRQRLKRAARVAVRTVAPAVWV